MRYEQLRTAQDYHGTHNPMHVARKIKQRNKNMRAP